MSKNISSKQMLFLLFITVLLAGCFPVAGTPPPPALLGEGVQSPLLGEVVGKWKLNNGSRFGNAILEFQSDGTLIVENTDDGTVKETTVHLCRR